VIARRSRYTSSVADMQVLKHWRGAARPSDHVPVTATLEV